MRLLLDTHALLWWLSDDNRLGQQARQRIADPDTEVLISVISLWEITIKVRIGKLRADIEDISPAIERDGFILLGVQTAHLQVLRGLPLYPDHRDPFDHLLVAQALAERATLVSEDRNIHRYKVPLMWCTDQSSVGST